MKRSKIFIVGCQRSGTTLLNMILGSHPSVTAYDEPISYAFETCFCKISCDACFWVSNQTAQQPLCQTPYVSYKVPKWTHQTAKIKKRFPKASLIFMKRNILAIVASMLSLKMKGGTWATKEAYKESLETISNLDNNILHQELTNIANNPLLLCTFCAYTKQLYTKDSIIVDYEKLVEKPFQTLSKLCEKLDLVWSNFLLKHHINYKSQQIGKTLGNRAIDNTSKEKYLKLLSNEQQKLIKEYLNHLEQIQPA